MAPVAGAVDIAAALKTLPVRCPRDYVYFLDSTAARFWFAHDAARRAVTELLAGQPHGGFLTPDDTRRYRLPVGDRRHWDACYLLEEGYVIHPDFFHTDPQTPMRGMHGYRPEAPDNQAAWIVGGDLRAEVPAPGAREMVDVATTVCRMLELDVPGSFQGVELTKLEL